MKLKVSLLGLVLSFQVHAGSDVIEKNQALNVVKNYANSIACDTTFNKGENGKVQTTINDVYVINKDIDNWGQNEFFVLWAGDQACAGGSGTYYATLTQVIKMSKNRPYIVTGDYPFGEDVDKHINYRFISEFKQLSNNLFKITSGKFAEDDPNAGPSLQDSIIIENKEGMGWKVISSKVSKLEL
ncbi:MULTISPECIES: hypothetical protein [unclassified Acinetobacter]|uniref:hypothetical protein n=1 Tax=unclassified Acinetobacter TaxID=196816 RepID=UPI00102317E0|nr:MULTISPECIES: hypothetical protein [unclassified Acinetobacter]RZG76622.1 hypothetical protein EXE09_06205 [Acinetobacter sp. WCHAc060025]RZG77068.1 hypothetical protein EXE10_19460 [Acinetobacter sp. WCHAc060033]